jgi:hypothetical protein
MPAKVRVTNGDIEFSDDSGNFGSGSRFGKLSASAAGTVTFVGQTDGDKLILGGMQTGSGGDSLATKEYVDASKCHSKTTVVEWVTNQEMAYEANAIIRLDFYAYNLTASYPIVGGAGVAVSDLFPSLGGDGPVVGDRILIKDGSNASYSNIGNKINGVYVFANVTTGSVALTRAPDFDSGREFIGGMMVTVTHGTDANKMYMLTTDPFATVWAPSGLTLQAGGVGDTVLTYSGALTAPVASDIIAYGASSTETHVRAGQALHIGDHTYEVLADSTAAATITIAPPLRETHASGAVVYQGYNLRGEDGDDVNASSGTTMNGTMAFQHVNAGTTYTAGAGLTDSSSTFNVVNATNGGLTVNANDMQVNLNDLAAAAVDVASDSIAIIDADDNGSKKESIADLMTGVADGSTITASSGVLTAANVTVGTTAIAPGGSSTTIAGLDSVTGSSTLTLASVSNNHIIIAPNGTGDVQLDADTVRVGDADATATITSNGDADLVLQTGNATTGTITITDGADGDITLAPNGSGTIACSSKRVSGVAAPTATTDAVNKTYADAVGRLRARVATVTTIPNITGVWVYDSGAGTLTAAGNGAHPVIDGVTLVVNDYVLIKDGFAGAVTNGVGNSDNGCHGLYEVTTLGTGGATHVYTRVGHMNATDEFPGAKVYIEEGTANATKTFQCTATPASGATNTFALNSGTADLADVDFAVVAGTLDIAGLTGESGIVAADSLAFYDATAGANRKCTLAQLGTAMADGSTITDSAGVLTAADVTVGTTAISPGGSSTTVAGLTSLTGDSAGLSLVAAGANQDVRVTPTGTGAVVVGTGSAAGIVESSGAQNVTLRTGNATTGAITIVDGANGDMQLFPNGTGAVVVGGSAPVVTAIAGQELTLSTTSADQPVIIAPHGSGIVTIGGSAPEIQAVTSTDLILSTLDNNQNVVLKPHGTGEVHVDGSQKIFAATASSDLVIGCDSSNQLLFDDDGDVAIFNASGGIEADVYTTSDERLKDNMVVIADAGAKLDQICGYTFVWKRSGRRSSGCKAQEVEKVLGDYAVRDAKDDEIGEKKVLKYDGVIGLLVQAVKEGRAEAKADRARFAALEAKVAALEAQVCKCMCKPDCCK